MKALDLDVLAMLVAVADTGNITRAAEVVHRTQSAVSMQIKTLENALGKPLFVRKPRSVTLTQDGEVLLTYARRMLALRDEAWAAVVRAAHTGRGGIGGAGAEAYGRWKSRWSACPAWRWRRWSRMARSTWCAPRA